MDLKLLRRDAHTLLDATARRNQQGWQRLGDLHQRAFVSVRDEITAGDGRRMRLDRSDEAARLLAMATESAAMVVSGESGVGKSALVLRSLTAAAEEDPDLMQVMCVNLRQVPPLAVELEAVLGCPLSALLGELSAPKRLLVVDGADAAAEGRHDAFTYMVDAALASGVAVVAVAGVDSRQIVHDLLAARLDTGVAEHSIPLLSDTEIDGLVETFTELGRLHKPTVP